MQTIQKAERSVAAGTFAGAPHSGSSEHASSEPKGQKTRAMLRARLGDDIFLSWFHTLEFESYEAQTVKVSVPVKFLRTWIQSHYADDLLACCRAEFKGADKVEVVLRQPGGNANARPQEGQPAAPNDTTNGARNGAHAEHGQRGPSILTTAPAAGRTSVGGFEGSPLDPRYTFESFVVGSSNRMAHAGATQVAETALGEAPGFNPLYIHSAVGLGKTHLLHAIAWEVKRRAPNAQVLYLTAERFRYQFVEALRSHPVAELIDHELEV